VLLFTVVVPDNPAGLEALGVVSASTPMAAPSDSKVAADAAAATSDIDSTLFIASGDETSRQPFVWNVKSGLIRQKLRPHNHTILDVRHCAISGAGGSSVLAALSDDQLFVYHSASSYAH